MKKTTYIDHKNFIAGMTNKDAAEPELNNMALHACVDPFSIIENREKLAVILNCTIDDFVCANQTHSANFHQVTSEDKGRGATQVDTAIPNTDALYTFEPNLLLCSFTADCVPVFFYSEADGLVGVIHSGWQGTVKEITLKVFEHLKQVEKCDISKIHVYIGAALSQKKFEVDEDVYLKFHGLRYAEEFIEYKEKTNKYHIDNQQTVRMQCELAGIPMKQIQIDKTCTFKSSEGFSYREDRNAGRHLNYIMKKK